jgi:hypothetical protein
MLLYVVETGIGASYASFDINCNCETLDDDAVVASCLLSLLHWHALAIVPMFEPERAELGRDVARKLIP